ncbi:MULTISPECIES: hypothetical protein [Sphingomonadaceae]|uniref:hypothetical protein n=1 Tax=Sphingomonadales TaxID=204457 RepID=UPI001D525712|nr:MULTISPECIES: hypothetical protein [Sphingomonadaceae]MBX9663021.1 hypothetical protein [Novosphingobium sp.]MBY0621141.1 hypothetical protein [Sphingomonas ursincola]
MDDRDREILALELAEDFRRLGAPELADVAAYAEDTPDGRYRPEPRKRLLLMLEALDRMIALEDAATLDDARNRLRQAMDQPVPELRILPMADEGGGVRDPLFFDLPHLVDVRQDLHRLIDAIMRDEGGPDPEETAELA